MGGGSLCERQAPVLATSLAKAGPATSTGFPPWRTGWRCWPSWPFEVIGPLSPLGEAWDMIPLLSLSHTSTLCQDTNTHIFAYPHWCRHRHAIFSRSIEHPKKYDLPPCLADMHTHKHTCVYPPSSTQTYTYICVACADKGQAGSSQSAPGSVLIKEQDKSAKQEKMLIIYCYHLHHYFSISCPLSNPNIKVLHILAFTDSSMP